MACHQGASAMRLDWNVTIVMTFALLLKSGCVSVRYDDLREAQLPTPAQPIACDTTFPEELPTPASLEPENTLPPSPVPAPPALAGPEAGPSPPVPEACPTEALAGFHFHHRLKAWLYGHERTPSVAPVIPPHSKFHPVPTRPVFAQPVIYYDDIPRPLPTKVGKPMPVPPPADVEPDLADHEAGAPKQLGDELRIARPLSLEGPVRPIADGWKAAD